VPSIQKKFNPHSYLCEDYLYPDFTEPEIIDALGSDEYRYSEHELLWVRNSTKKTKAAIAQFGKNPEALRELYELRDPMVTRLLTQNELLVCPHGFVRLEDYQSEINEDERATITGRVLDLNEFFWNILKVKEEKGHDYALFSYFGSPNFEPDVVKAILDEIERRAYPVEAEGAAEYLICLSRIYEHAAGMHPILADSPRVFEALYLSSKPSHLLEEDIDKQFQQLFRLLTLYARRKKDHDKLVDLALSKRISISHGIFVDEGWIFSASNFLVRYSEWLEFTGRSSRIHYDPDFLSVFKSYEQSEDAYYKESYSDSYGYLSTVVGINQYILPTVVRPDSDETFYRFAFYRYASLDKLYEIPQYKYKEVCEEIISIDAVADLSEIDPDAITTETYKILSKTFEYYKRDGELFFNGIRWNSRHYRSHYARRLLAVIEEFHGELTNLDVIKGMTKRYPSYFEDEALAIQADHDKKLQSAISSKVQSIFDKLFRDYEKSVSNELHDLKKRNDAQISQLKEEMRSISFEISNLQRSLQRIPFVGKYFC